MKTYTQKKAEAFRARRWVAIDATGIPVGRLASQVVTLLRGKHKAAYTRNVDGGDFVVVLNASQVKFTGNKGETKRYYWHSEYIGGIKDKSAVDMLKKNPQRVVMSAVRGMLPRGPLGFRMLRKLKVYAGAEHPHKAQLPENYQIKL